MYSYDTIYETTSLVLSMLSIKAAKEFILISTRTHRSKVDLGPSPRFITVLNFMMMMKREGWKWPLY